MKFRELENQKVLKIDTVSGRLLVSGISAGDTANLEADGICSLKVVGSGSVMIRPYDFENLKRRLKDYGYSEAVFDTDASYSLVKSYTDNLELIEKFSSKEVMLESIKFNGELFKIQKAGVAFLLFLRVAGLFDEMGVGKTVQVLGALQFLKERLGSLKSIVVAPETVKLEWKLMIEEFTDLTVSLLSTKENFEGKKQIVGLDGEVVLVHYEQIIDRKVRNVANVRKSELFESLKYVDYDVLVIDESHFIKNMTAKRTKKLVSLFRKRVGKENRFFVGKVDNIDIFSSEKLPYIWFLTGTPMERPRDVYIMLRTALENFVGIRTFMKVFTKFEEKWFYRKKLKVAVGGKNEESLVSLVGQVALRRKRSEIVEIDKLERRITLRLSEKHREIYSSSSKSGDTLSRIIKRIQFCNHPKLLGYDLPSPKFNALMDLVQSTDKKIVVWTVFRKSVDLILEELKARKIKAVGFKGGDDREEVSKAFMEGDTQVVVATIAKGQVGINFLRAASIVVYMEKPYSYTQWKQSRDRVMRINRDLSEPVLFVEMYIEDGSDDVLNEVIDRKTTLNTLVTEGLVNVD